MFLFLIPFAAEATETNIVAAIPVAKSDCLPSSELDKSSPVPLFRSWHSFPFLSLLFLSLYLPLSLYVSSAFLSLRPLACCTHLSFFCQSAPLRSTPLRSCLCRVLIGALRASRRFSSAGSHSIVIVTGITRPACTSLLPSVRDTH